MTLKQELRQIKIDIEKKKLEESKKIENEEKEYKDRRKKRILENYFDLYYNEIVETMKIITMQDGNELSLKFRYNDDRYYIAEELVKRFKKEKINAKMKYTTITECDDTGSYDQYYSIEYCLVDLIW